jgi:putative tryptophan/tyrosine transport system substrate-binding protein
MPVIIGRRELIGALGGMATAWPLAARAQQCERMRHIGVLIALAQSDPEAKAWVGGFLQGLGKRGWSEDRNLHCQN